MDDLNKFASILWKPEDLIEVRLLPTTRASWPAPESNFVFAEDLLDIKSKLEKKNEAGHNVFVGVVPRRNSSSTTDMDCLNASVLWADFDGVSQEEAVNTIKEKNMPEPSLTVNSGHGTHFYWKLDKTVPAYAAAKVVHDMAHYLGSDTSVANPSRIMRLPGYQNLKKPQAPCSIVSSNDNIYSMEAISEIVPSASFYSGVKKPEGFGEGYKIARDRREHTDRASAYVAAFSPVQEGGRNHAAFSLGACLRKDFALEEQEAWVIMQEWNQSKCSPALTENELYSCLVSGERYGKHAKGEKIQEPEVRERKVVKEKAEVKEEKAQLIDVIKAEIAQEIAGTRAAIKLPWKCLEQLPLMFPGKVGVITGFPGACKSYFALNLGRGCQKACKPWAYVPLEDTRAYHSRRLLSVAMGNWELATSFAAVAERRQQNVLDQLVEDYGSLATSWGEAVLDNPAFVGDKMVAVDHSDALDMIQELCSKKRVVIIDPIAQIEFVGKNEWQVQAQWMRDLIGIANSSEATVLLVIHRAKRDNSGVYGVEGSKRFTDLAHTVISLDKHKGAATLEVEGEEQEVDCNRVIVVEKCRDSVLEGSEWGFNFGVGGPLFKEEGRVIKRAKKT